jgi:Na+-transporting methylmalonyl-CoA/oxaloacetate decarboxylase gamma subunit
MSEATMRYGTRSRAARRSAHALREGITVGLIGAAIVMLWLFIVDVAAGVPLRTPALLGAALFDGARYANAVTPTARLVVGYTALHLAGFVALGLGVAGLFALAEREKRVLALIFIVGCCLAVVFLAMVYLLSLWLGQAVTPAIFLAGHVFAFVSMVAAFVYFHGRLLRRMPEALDGE